jgi:hypothetical protein
MDSPLIQGQPNLAALLGGNGNTLTIPSHNSDDGLPPGLIEAIIQQESGGKAKARGKKGEGGLMQIMPTTAAQFGVTPEQLFDPNINRAVGTKYLKQLISKYKGDIPTALAAYNAGPHNVDMGRVPKSTESYVSKIMGSLKGGLEGTAYAEDLPPALRGAKEVAGGSEPWSKQLEGAEVANPWGGAAPAKSNKTGMEASYEKNISGPVTGGLASMLQKLDPRGSMFSGAAAEKAGGTPARMDSGTAQSIASSVVPQNLTEAGIDAALMGTGLGEMGLLGRLGLVGMGGALGAKAQGNSALGGFGRGVASEAGGEAIGGLTGIGARALGKNKMLQGFTSDVGKGLGDTIGSKIGIRSPESTAAIERVFKLGGAANRAGQIAGDISKRAEASLGGKLIRINPALSDTPVTLQEAEDIIQSLNEGTYLPSGAARGVQGRGTMLRHANELREQVARRLNAASPGMGTAWRQSRRDLGGAMALRDLFNEPGVFEGKTLNQPKLEQLITSKKYYSRLQNTLGGDETSQLVRTIRRGGSGPSTDIPSQAPHLGLSPHGFHIGRPRTYKPAGNAPALMRKGATNPMRVPGGVATSNALDFWNAPMDDQGQ